MNLNQINSNLPEGKLLLAALAIITTTKPYTNKTPNDVLLKIEKLSKKMFGEKYRRGDMLSRALGYGEEKPSIFFSDKISTS